MLVIDSPDADLINKYVASGKLAVITDPCKTVPYLSPLFQDQPYDKAAGWARNLTTLQQFRTSALNSM
jgi:hypothetical protein